MIFKIENLSFLHKQKLENLVKRVLHQMITFDTYRGRRVHLAHQVKKVITEIF